MKICKKTRQNASRILPNMQSNNDVYRITSQISMRCSGNQRFQYRFIESDVWTSQIETDVRSGG